MDIQLRLLILIYFYSLSHLYQTIITATNKVFTTFQSAYNFQEHNGIKYNRVNFFFLGLNEDWLKLKKNNGFPNGQQSLSARKLL